MSEKKLEVIPPEKRVLLENRDNSSLSALHDLQPRGIIESALTGFQAEMQSRAYAKIASAIRAQTDALEAETARKSSALKLLRKARELEEAPDIVALDRAERSMDRAEAYEELKHRAELNKRRRQRELEEADRKVVDVQYATFNSRQGLENAERLKQLNLEIWEKRAATEGMEAEKVRAVLGREIDGIKNSKKGEGTLEHLAELRASLEQRARDAAATGDASKAERYERLAVELDELVLAAMRGDAGTK